MKKMKEIKLSGKLEGMTVGKDGNDAYVSQLDIDKFMAVTVGGFLKCMFREGNEEFHAVRVYRVKTGVIDKNTGLFRRTQKWSYVGVVETNFNGFVVHDAFDEEGNLKILPRKM